MPITQSAKRRRRPLRQGGSTAERELNRLCTLLPAEEWNDEDGAVLWWHLPVDEQPPMVGYGPGSEDAIVHGRPSACAVLIGQGYLTHWSPLPDTQRLVAIEYDVEEW